MEPRQDHSLQVNTPNFSVKFAREMVLKTMPVSLFFFMFFLLSEGGRAMPLCARILARPSEEISATDFFKRRDFSTYGMLSKDHQLIEEIRELPVSQDLRENLREMGPYNHLASHFTRLLRNGKDTVEGTFAIAAIRNQDLIPRGNTSASYTILVEGWDTALWWTFAPYIFYLLKEKGIADSDAIKRLVCWADSADPKADLISLEGLWTFPKSFVLDPDPEHLTHRFAYQEANRLVETLSCFIRVSSSGEF